MNALNLRQQINPVCMYSDKDDDTFLQYDPVHIRLFLRTAETGLQDKSICAKIHPFLKDPSKTDENTCKCSSFSRESKGQEAEK